MLLDLLRKPLKFVNTVVTRMGANPGRSLPITKQISGKKLKLLPLLGNGETRQEQLYHVCEQQNNGCCGTHKARKGNSCHSDGHLNGRLQRHCRFSTRTGSTITWRFSIPLHRQRHIPPSAIHLHGCLIFCEYQKAGSHPLVVLTEQLLSETFLNLRRIQREHYNKYTTSSYKVPFIVVYFNQTRIF